MAKLIHTLEVDLPMDEVFAFIGDFANSSAWDPGVAESERIGEGPVAVGTRYRLVALFNGRRLPLQYTVTEWVPPRQVVLEGRGDRFYGLDDIRFDPLPGGGTRITYEADLRLTGPFRVFEPFMKGRFHETGRNAIEGMREALARRGGAAGTR
jgi:carbon monoxide dehydrogenase subunit G